MNQPLLLTGFEPFLNVSINPSGEVARRLSGRVLKSAAGQVEIVGAVLPVSFSRAPMAHSEALAGLPAPPVAIVSLGVHRGPEFRLETRAGVRYASGQPDNDGQMGAGILLDGPEQLETPYDLIACESWLVEAGAPATMISGDAGGYLCERVFRAGLDVPGVPALFLHVPPVEALGIDEQVRVIEGFLARLAGRPPREPS